MYMQNTKVWMQENTYNLEATLGFKELRNTKIFGRLFSSQSKLESRAQVSKKAKD